MISENLKIIKEKIEKVAIRTGRSPNEIKLVAVSKRFPAEKINEAATAGHTLFGENYIQELQTKRDLVPANVDFHFIGHLQSNKAKFAAETCRMVETVDRLKLGKMLNKHLIALNRTMDILIQVNIGNDPNKAGLEYERVDELLVELNKLTQLKVCGLMTMPPFSENPEQSRPHFKNLRQLAERLTTKGLFPGIKKPELSMGMSEDFPIAIEEGATIIRVGTAIFGRRQPLNR